jgi:hypothetical protein
MYKTTRGIQSSLVWSGTKFKATAKETTFKAKNYSTLPISRKGSPLESDPKSVSISLRGVKQKTEPFALVAQDDPMGGDSGRVIHDTFRDTV